MRQSVVIIGAWSAGLCLASSLASTSLEITVVDKQLCIRLENPVVDGRDIALTHSSRKILEDLGIWKRIPVDLISPIREVKVIDGDSSYALHFNSHVLASDSLGYLVPNCELKKSVYETIKTYPNIKLIDNQSVTSVTAHEFNLGLKDQHTLSSMIKAALIENSDICSDYQK